MNFRRDFKRRSTIFDMTPMIDVALQLIIFFLFTSQVSHVARSRMELPEERGDPQRAPTVGAVVVDVTRDGAYLVEGRSRTLEEVAGLVGLERVRAESSGVALELLIRADRECPAAHLNILATRLASAGVRHWKLGTSASSDAGGAR